MQWHEYYQVYLGLLLHFKNESYDYVKYGAKRIPQADCARFYRALKSIESHGETREEFERRLIANFKSSQPWLTALYSKECDSAVATYQEELASWRYYLKRDMERLSTIVETSGQPFKRIFISDAPLRPPIIVSELVAGRISYHSFVCLEAIIKFCDKIPPMLLDTNKVKKYSELHQIDKRMVAAIVKPFLERLE